MTGVKIIINLGSMAGKIGGLNVGRGGFIRVIGVVIKKDVRLSWNSP